MALSTQSLHAQAAAPKLPDPAQTDPVKLGWMQGFPPPADKIIRFADGSMYKFPQLRWSFNHIRQLIPTRVVLRDAAAMSTLPRAERELDGIRFKTMGGEEMTWPQALANTYTDGILVMHKGNVVYERYFGAGAPERPHIAMSVTKSVVGTLAAMLVADGVIDPKALVTTYVPELMDGAYGDATVREVMDMTIGVKYDETYADPKAEIWDYVRAGGMIPRPPGYSGPTNFYDFLTSLQKEGEHGQAFAYKTVNAEVLAWIVQRASGKALSQLLSERVWRKLGAESDAFFQVDSIGIESGGGGLNTVLRDLARFGEMMRDNGRFNGQQIIPASVVADIRKGGDPSKFAKANLATLPGWSYRDMWWVSNNAHGAFMARGIHGQSIYIDPKAEMVIARYASHPIAANGANDPITLPAFAAVAEALMR